MTAIEAVKATRTELKLSDLYRRVIMNCLSDDDRYFLCKLIEHTNQRAELIFSETHYIDLKQPSLKAITAFGAHGEHETQVIPLREANDKLMIAAATLRERLEKVEKALKEARDVLVMASLIDKTSTCMDAVNEIDQLLTKEG